MPDILQDFIIKAPVSKIFEVMADAKGLEKWWTKKSSGKLEVAAKYELDFGPGYIWHAVVSKYEPGKKFELTMGTSDPDWEGTHVGFEVEEKKGNSQVRFYHTGWPSVNEHYRISTYCWAMYLRLAKRYAEKGETVPYEKRLDA